MISRTKITLNNDQVRALFRHAGFSQVEQIEPLGAGEYNAVYAAIADGKPYAIKVSPEKAVAVMSHENGMMQAELFWYDQIRAHTDIRIPAVYFSDFEQRQISADFFIMEKLCGSQLDKMDFAPDEKVQADVRLATMAAQIHRIANDRFGYVQCGLHEDWYRAIRAMTEMALADGKRVNKISRRGQRLLTFIDRYRDVLEKAECCMVNFDLYAPNVLCNRADGGIEYAWIDPERSFWGDPIADFVCLEIMKPLAEKTASLAAYNAAATKSVSAGKAENIRYAVALGYLALIMETEKYYRYTRQHFGWWRNVMASKMFYERAFRILDEAQ